MPKNRDVIAIYSRKSRFTGKGESIGNQVELCRAYIRTAFGDAYAENAVVYEDEGFSGGNLNRPGFKKMMKAARERQCKAVVVYRLDRISRNIGDFSRLIEELGRLGVDFVSIREKFDTSSPMGRAMMYIASVFSQLERETIAERIRDNMRELAKTGRWLGGVTPTGYTSEAVKTVTVDGKSKKACRLKLIPEEAELVCRIYELYGETGSLAGTEAELLRLGLKTKTGHDFSRFSIKAILQNPVYLRSDGAAWRYFTQRQAEVCSGPESFDGVRGILAYNRTDQQKGRSTVYLPVSQWIIAVGQHPGLIPSELWIRTQESLERNKSGGYRTSRGNQALLTGLLRCRCGGRMYPKCSRRRTEEGDAVYTYVCKQKERSKGALCGADNVGGNQLDATVLELIQDMERDGNVFADRLEQGSQSLRRQENTPERAELEVLRRQRAELRRKMNGLVDSLAEFGDSAAAGHIRERIEQLHSQSAGLEARIVGLEHRSGRLALDGPRFEELCRQLGDFGACIDRMSVEQRRWAMRRLVRQVIWDGQQARVVLYGAEETLLGEDSK